MTKRTIFVTLFASLAIAACGDDRPVTNNPQTNNPTTNNPTTNNPTTNNPTTNNPTTNNPTTNNPTTCPGTCENMAATCDGNVLTTYSGAAFGDPPACECVQGPTMTTCGEGEICDAAAGACVADPNIACEVDMTFTGQIEGAGTLDGGVFSTSDASLADDAGIMALRTFIQGKVTDGTLSEESNSLDLAEAEQLTITEALITSVTGSESPIQITLQDKMGAVILRFSGQDAVPTMDKDGAAFTFKVGHKISFKATRVLAFFGNTPQIGDVTDLELVSADNDVFVLDATGADINVAEHWMEIVRVGGRVKELTNDMCGKIAGKTAKCYAFEHGPDGAKKTIELRTGSDFVKVGECGTFVGPVGSFPGPFEMDSKPQLNSDQFDWYRGPFRDQD